MFNELQKTIVFIIGPPLSGKSTQINKLMSFFDKDVSLLSMGSEIRKYAKNHVKIANMIQQGIVVPDYITRNIFLHRVAKTSTSLTIVDGYPRTIKQISAIMKALPYYQKMLTIELYVPNVILEERMKSRGICSKCDLSISTNDSTCPVCYASIIKRADDNSDSLKHRISFYFSMRNILGALMRNRTNYYSIDGYQDESKVFQDILSCLV